MEKILVIEPDTLLCQEAVKEIRGLGYSKVFSAFNGEEALLLLQKEKPHLVVLNMSLPDYFGLEFPELVSSKSIVYGKPCFILLWDSFFVLETPSLLEKKYRIMHLIRKPYEVTQLLEPVKSILSSEIISAPSASVSQDIPVEYIQVFIESAENFFQTMTSIQPKVGQFFFKNDPFSQSGVSARMEIKGVMEGTVCISFDKPVATFVVSDMLQEEMEEFNEDVKDGIGEVVNIITGNTKSFFQQKKIPFEIGLPKIFTGKHYTHPLSPKVPCIVVPFITPRGTLFVEICVMINEHAKLEGQEAIPSVKVQQSKQQEMVTQPDIAKLQAEMAATMPKPPQEEPPPVKDVSPAAGGLSQADIEKMQAEMIASPAKQEEAEPVSPLNEEAPPHVAEQPDIISIQAEMTPSPAMQEKEESPEPASSAPPGAMSQADIEKIQAEMMANLTKKPEPPAATEEDAPAHVAEQPDIEKLQAEIEASAPSEPQEKPKPHDIRPQLTPEELQRIQSQMAAQNGAEQKQEIPPAEQAAPSPPPKPMTPPAQDEGKPKIILSKAPILKHESKEGMQTGPKPMIMSSSQPSLNIEPKKPSGNYRFKPSEPNAQPSNIHEPDSQPSHFQPPTPDDEPKPEQP